MTAYCLDAWVVIAWLQGEEPSYGRLQRLVDQGPVMNWITLGEVFYITRRREGTREAADVVAQLRRKLTMDEASPQRVIEAAMIKSDHAISYADSFAVATALAHEAVLLTGDPEILDADAGWPVEDIR